MYMTIHMAHDLCSLTPENIEYRGEGNAGLIIRLKKEKKVLKLKKDETSKPSMDNKILVDQIKNQVHFIENVLKPLIGEPFIHTPEIVFIKKQEIKFINNLVNHFRPAHRKNKIIKENDTYALMFDDYCSMPPNLSIYPSYGPTLCVEIKIKQGFLWKEECLSPEHLIRSKVCTFCMMQFCKMKKNIISKKSGYCPTDLFSGCSERMFHALKMLMQTPQNNFKIFKDLELLYCKDKQDDLNKVLGEFFLKNDSERNIKTLSHLIIQGLLKQFSYLKCKQVIGIKNIIHKNCIYALHNCSDNGCSNTSISNSILDRIFYAQALHGMDILDLYQLYNEMKEFKEFGNQRQSDNIGCFSRTQIPPYVGEKMMMPTEIKYEFISRKIWEFLVALTIKDCSLMLTFKHLITSSITEKENIISDEDGNLYLFSLSVVDLDMKQLNKVDKAFQDSYTLVDTYQLSKMEK